jgi:hypothetical protein
VGLDKDSSSYLERVHWWAALWMAKVLAEKGGLGSHFMLPGQGFLRASSVSDSHQGQNLVGTQDFCLV